MTKTLFTLLVDDYSPEIVTLTFPLLERYARKIGASFHVITERRFPAYPVVYEKLQIFDLGRGSDWSLYIDADALVHPDLFDITEHLSKDTVLHNGRDLAGNRWSYDKYFRRDGRHIGSCNWFTLASDWCLDLWRPLEDLTLDEALSNIFPITAETERGIVTREHLIDDYTLSRNIARFGLHFTTLGELQARVGDKGNYLWHQYLMTTEEKVAAIKGVLKEWKLLK